MSDYGHGLNVGDVCVLYGLSARWNETRMKVTGFTPNRVEGTITYKHPSNDHSYRVGSALNIRHENCKLAVGDPPPIPELKVGGYVEVIRGGCLGMQFQVVECGLTPGGVTRGTVVYKGSNNTSYELGASVSFYTRDLKIITMVSKPRIIFAKDGGWGP